MQNSADIPIHVQVCSHIHAYAREALEHFACSKIVEQVLIKNAKHRKLNIKFQKIILKQINATCLLLLKH